MRKTIIFSLTLTLLFASLVSGLADGEVAVKDKTGYIVVNGIYYALNNGFYIADEARIFYTFQAAKENPEKKPVFVMFNGGPGAATTANLFSMNTASYTLCKDFVPQGALNSKNPYAWTDMANLLYIDAPNTGFSYNQDVNPGPCDLQGGLDTYITGRNFNPLTDAAQMVRAMLGALKETNVQKNQIIIVGESYGGVRATTMLHMLFFYDYSPILNSRYWDLGLREEIQNHYNVVFNADNKIVSPTDIAKQFGYNILIQPQLTGEHHRKRTLAAFCPSFPILRGVLDKLAAKKGIDGGKFIRCSQLPWLWRSKYRTMDCIIACSVGGDLTWSTLWMTYNNIDPYNSEKPADWTDKLDAFAVQSLTTPSELAKIMALGDMGNFPDLIHKGRDTYSYHSAQIPFLTVADNKAGSLSGPSEFGRQFDFPSIIGKNSGVDLNFRTLSNAGVYGILNGDALRYIFANAKKMDNFNPLSNNLNDYYGPLPNCPNEDNCCDSYYKSWDMSISLVNYLYPEQPNNVYYGRMFLFNLAVLKGVIITNAANDMMIYSPTLPLSFKDFEEVKDVDIEQDKDRFTIVYKSKALDILLPTPVRRTITWPKYEKSGHAVSSTQPKKLHDDIEAFLKKNKLID
jgi:hypothetical protein